MLLTEIYEELPLISLPKKSNGESTTISIKSEDMEAGYEKKEDKKQESKLIFPMFSPRSKNRIFLFFQGIPKCKVEVTYVVNPSLFFVRRTALKSEFGQLEKDLTKYGDDRQSVEPLIKLEPGTNV